MGLGHVEGIREVVAQINLFLVSRKCRRISPIWTPWTSVIVRYVRLGTILCCVVCEAGDHIMLRGV